MEYNFATTVDDVITANFQTVYRMMDALGGLDIELTEEEEYVNAINGVLIEQNKLFGREDHLDYTGDKLYHLNGSECLAYVRMRYVGDCSDSSRNERQRYFLQQFILQKGHYLIFEPWKLDREGMHEAAQTMYTTMDTTDFTRLMQKLTSGSYSIETDGVLPQPLKWDTFRQNGEQYIFIPDAFPSLIEQTKNELGMQ